MAINIIKGTNRNHGFTIVELLVVIVVIGILAAITIVSYSGVTSRAKTASAQSAAKGTIDKINAYLIDANAATNYPTTLAALTGASADGKTYDLSGVTYGAPGSGVDPSVIRTSVCGYKTVAGVATDASSVYADIIAPPALTGGVITGMKVEYYKYDPTVGIQTLTMGVTSGSTPIAITCVVTGS